MVLYLLAQIANDDAVFKQEQYAPQWQPNNPPDPQDSIATGLPRRLTAGTLLHVHGVKECVVVVQFCALENAPRSHKREPQIQPEVCDCGLLSTVEWSATTIKNLLYYPCLRCECAIWCCEYSAGSKPLFLVFNCKRRSHCSHELQTRQLISMGTSANPGANMHKFVEHVVMSLLHSHRSAQTTWY